MLPKRPRCIASLVPAGKGKVAAVASDISTGCKIQFPAIRQYRLAARVRTRETGKTPTPDK
jgi:hypothetical protein